MHDDVLRSASVPVREWGPGLPIGRLDAIYVHWTAGDYAELSAAYHFCLSGARDVRVHATHDLRANMRDVRTEDGPYAAHTCGRNSFAAGVAVCAMRAATPADFGSYPITPDQVEALCAVAAVLVRAYGIDVQRVRTHAEAAVDDGYFGADGDERRWDIARLAPSSRPLLPADARAVGDELRARVAACGRR